MRNCYCLGVYTAHVQPWCKLETATTSLLTFWYGICIGSCSTRCLQQNKDAVLSITRGIRYL
jgi:hypothetical protein